MGVGLPSRYREAVLVARGPIGDVYRARDDVLDRVVAVKLVAERFVLDPEQRRRFRREAAAMARLSGALGVVAVYDFGEAEGAAYLVMEWCPNGSVLDYARQRPHVDVSRVLTWMSDAAEGLDAAHAAGLVHGDLKPANLLLDAGCRTRVADFGIARLAEDQADISDVGARSGMAGYLAPEQARGKPATAASDRYALAVIAFELLCGRRPFQSENPVAEIEAHAAASIPRISDLASIPAAANRVFERALAKRPVDRYSSAGDFVSVLRAALRPLNPAPAIVSAQATPIAATHHAPARTRPPFKWWGAAAVGCLLAALLGAGGGYLASRSASDTAPQIFTETLTAQGTTVTRVLTKRMPAPTPSTLTVTSTVTASPTPTGIPPPTMTAHQLNDEGYALINQARYAEAVPLLERAVAALRGAGPADRYEGFANYNLGYALVELGRCRAAIPPLLTANRLEPGKSVTIALNRARACA
jgi:serine/threonine-protein kinase